MSTGPQIILGLKVLWKTFLDEAGRRKQMTNGRDGLYEREQSKL